MTQEFRGPQQSSPARPAASGWPAATQAGPAALSPKDAAKSKRWRVILGCTAIFLALISGFYGYLNWAAIVRATSAIRAAGGFVPDGAMAGAVAIVTVFCVLAVCYAGVGIWNLVARNSTSKAPLVAAVVLAAVALVLIVLYTVSRPSGVTQIGALGLNALIIVRAAVVLRMKTGPAAANLG